MSRVNSLHQTKNIWFEESLLKLLLFLWIMLMIEPRASYTFDKHSTTLFPDPLFIFYVDEVLSKVTRLILNSLCSTGQPWSCSLLVLATLWLGTARLWHQDTLVLSFLKHVYQRPLCQNRASLWGSLNQSFLLNHRDEFLCWFFDSGNLILRPSWRFNTDFPCVNSIWSEGTCSIRSTCSSWPCWVIKWFLNSQNSSIWLWIEQS